MAKVLILLLYFVLALLRVQSAPGTEFFENLDLQIPQGPFFPGDKVRFSCATDKLDNNGGGRLDWIFQIDNLLFRQVHVDPEDDLVQISEGTVNRTSYLTIPSDGATALACRWVDGSHEYKKIVNIDVLNIRVFTLESIYPLLNQKQGPQLVIERFNPKNLDHGPSQSAKYLLPHIITNQSVELPGGIKSFRLSCIHLDHYHEEGNEGNVEYNWSSTTDKHVDRDPVVLLNNLALVNQKAMTSGRFPLECFQNGSLRLDPGVRSEVLEVIIPPLESPRSTKYTCRGSRFGSEVTIRFNGMTKGTMNSQKDDEFLELITTVMQILENSNSNGGGSGPLYGVGFGSSTIMVLMGLTIYYLKRQLKQLQEQIKENECKKRKRTLVTDTEDDEL